MLNCNNAKKIDLVSYLKKQGFKTGKANTKDVWFYSPFKKEKIPSFKVSIIKNVFFDHSAGVGGTIIDFVMKYNNCSIKEALVILNADTFSFHQQPKFIKPDNNSNYEITKVGKIKHPNLISYIQQRKLNFDFTEKFCFQVHYKFKNSTEYFGIGFLNDFGGFEIRNKYFKGCLGKKNITTINNNSDVVSLFEGWSDYLSYLTLKNEIPEENFIILNSTSMIKKVIELIEGYSVVKLFFDNDEAGDKITEIIKKNTKNKAIDNRIHYRNYNDLNEYLIKQL